MRTETVETFELVKVEPKPLREEQRERESPGSGNRRKKRIVLNRRPELYRGKYRCVQLKDQLVKKDVFMPVKTMFSCGTFRMSRDAFTRWNSSSGLHGNTAADSVRSGWPLWHAAKAKQSPRAGALNGN
ncbi:hypothetical protein TNCV_263291 [Trichonephila clavipes]|nr:hypothetical protein TNCV_263291 [Trichonephila clavipes]